MTPDSIPVRRKALRFALVLAALTAPGSALPSGSQAISVGAKVLSAGNCQFNNAGASALSFGAVNPSSSSDATAKVDIPYRCNGGAAATVAWSVSSNDGLNKAEPNMPRLRNAASPSHYMRYAIETPPSGASPKNIDLTMTVIGTLAAAEFQNALAGDYTDTIVLTIAP